MNLLPIQNFYHKNRRIISWILLVISVGIGFLTINRGIFEDEADSLVVGSLLLRGYNLYRDVFSHHFPFSYYWVAAIVGLFGKSILIARISVLLFQTSVLAIGMEISGYYLLFGVVAIIWSVMRSFYSGNLVVYSSFSGPAILLVYIIVVLIQLDRIAPNWKHWLLIGIFSIMAVLSDPLCGYAVGIAIIFLLTKKPRWGLFVSLVIGTGFLIYMGYLYFTGNLQAFWSDALLFNSRVYEKYVYANPLRIGDLINQAVKGLGIFSREWLNLNPLKHLTLEYTDLDRWVFTGFLYRFSIIAVSIFLAVRKQYRAAAFTYLFAASTLVVEKWGFRAQPFIMVSIMAIALLITHEWWNGAINKYWKVIQIAIGITVFAMVAWLGGRLSVNVYKLHDSLTEVQFTGAKSEAAYVQELTCNQPDVLLGYYPAGIYTYWFTGMKPVSKYIYLWPWVAEVGLEDVIQELAKEHALAVVIRHDTVVWELFDTKVYLRSLDEFLEKHYHKVKEGVYISPELHALCSK